MSDSSECMKCKVIIELFTKCSTAYGAYTLTEIPTASTKSREGAWKMKFPHGDMSLDNVSSDNIIDLQITLEVCSNK